MAEFPAFLFYPEDFEAGTADMSLAEVGLYMRCLCHEWHKGAVPGEPTRLARIAHATPDEIGATWPAVQPKFTQGDDGLFRNARLEQVRADLKANRRKRSRSGRAGAEARWGDGKRDSKRNGKSGGKRIANASQVDNKTMPSRVVNVNVTVDGFEEFWKVVPRKVGRRDAESAYDKAAALIAGRDGPGGEDPDGFLLDRMRLFAKSPQGCSGQYCPHPATWLNKGRYDDDPAEWQRAGRDTDPRGTASAAADFLGGFDGD